MKVEGIGGQQVFTQVPGTAQAQYRPSGVGQQLVDTAVTATKVYAQERHKADTAEAESALSEFQRAQSDLFYNPESGYLNKQGRDAYKGRETTAEQLRKLQQDYSAKLSSPAAQAMFNKSAGAYVTRGLTDIDRHASRGLQAWEQGSAQALVDNSIENAVTHWNDTERLEEQRAVGRAQLQDLAAMRGDGAEKIAEDLQTYDSSFYSTAVNAALASSSAEAEDVLGKYRDRMEGPDILKVEKAIATKKKAEETASIASMTSIMSARIIDTTETRQEAIDEVNKIEDGALRESVMKDTMYRYGQKKTAISEERAAAFESAEDFVMNGGDVTAFKAQNPDAWEKMSPEQKRKIQSGDFGATDWVAYSDLITLPRDQLAKVNPADHFTKLAKEQRSSLISAVKAARNGSPDAQIGRSRTAEAKAAAVELFGPAQDWKGDKARQVNVFYAAMDAEAAAREKDMGRPLSSQEYTSLLADYTRRVVTEGVLWDSTSTIKNIPAEDLPVLQQWLRDNQIPVTAENLLQAYSQASE